MVEVIHLFIHDKSFTNPALFVTPLQTADGICVLTGAVLANYLTPMEIKDPRSARITNLSFGNTLSVVTDGNSLVSDFIANYGISWLAHQATIFNLIDQLCFNFTSQANQAAWDTFLSGSSLYSIYVPTSVAFSPTSSATTVYINGNPVSITVPDYVSFKVTIQVNNVETTYQLYFWNNTAIFNQQYPVSTITAITIPLTFTDLLNVSVTAANYNALAIAAEASNTIYSDLTVTTVPENVEPITDGVSGFYTYSAKFVDGNGNFVFVPFNVLYKGHQPGILQIRLALKNLLLNSGVGNQTLWQARVPELFVNAQYYLIPIWDSLQQLPDNSVFPAIANNQTMLTNTGKVMYDIPAANISANMCAMVAAYNDIMFAATPDINNPSDRVSIILELPQYGFYATTETNFNLMPQVSKTFSQQLNSALPVAAGTVSPTAFQIVQLNNRSFVVFTVADVEYYVATKETYLNLIAAP